jgi:hypothetical protein
LVRAFQHLAAGFVNYVLASQRLYHVLFQEAGVSEEETMAPLRQLRSSGLCSGPSTAR